MKLIILSLFLALFFISPVKAETSVLTIKKMIVLDVDATINPAIANYLQTELSRPAPTEEVLFIIKMNTPGGLVSTTKDILSEIGKSQHPIVIWVTPEGASATSAGAIIASAGHGLVMSRGTNIGAATPVGMGEDIKEGDGRSKAVNDLTALVKSLSDSRGRNAEAFATMISSAASYTADDALKKGIIDGVTPTLEDIRVLYEGKSFIVKGQTKKLNFAAIVETENRLMDAGQSLLNIFANPTTAYILFVLGAALIYFEFQAPGGYIAGSAGALCLVLAAIGFQVLPLNVGAILLMLAGVVLLVLEIYIVSYGALAVAGLACFSAGSLFLYRHEDSFMTIQYPVIFSTLAGIATVLAVFGWVIAKKNNAQTFFTHLNEEGSVISILNPEGDLYLYQIKVRGEIWKARSSEKFEIGQKVKIKSENNNSLILEIYSVQ
jgi:membrane-bound serine protease (ClpP class)